MSPEQVASRRSCDQVSKIVSTWIPALHCTITVPRSRHSTGDAAWPGEPGSCVASIGIWLWGRTSHQVDVYQRSY